MKYKKKPVVIEAIQYNGMNGDEIEKWSDGAVSECSFEDYGRNCVRIETLEGVMIGSDEDYIIKGVNGEFYPCKPDVFDKTYEIVTD